MIAAKIVCDSIGAHGIRLTTIKVTMPRFLVAQMNTYRSFSRNSASSRAVPVAKMLDRARQTPFIPEKWGANRHGMAATECLPPAQSQEARSVWIQARDDAFRHASRLAEIGVHKQLANRLLEPFLFTTVLITATDWKHFFQQRLHRAAQDEMQLVAQAMHQAMDEGSGPTMLKDWEWHIPYGDRMPDSLPPAERMKVAVARCARLSYLTHDGKMDVAKDLELYQRLYDERHMSPFEHVAQCVPKHEKYYNLRAWMSFRYALENDLYDD